MTAETLQPLEALLALDVRALLDSIPAAIFVKDAESRLILMNKACEDQWGMAFSDLRGTNGSHLFPAEQMAQFLAKDREVFANGRQIDFEEEVWNAKLQQSRIGQTFKRPVYDADGRPLYLIGVTIDITDRINAEADFRATDEKLRRLYEMSPIGIALTDMSGRYIDFNAAFQRICGYTFDELGRLDYWALTPKEYARQEAEQLESLARRGSYGPYEKEYIRKDGSRIPLCLNGVLIHGSDGQSYIWSIVEDITERKKKDELIWQQANFDPVTDLPNRRLMRDRLEQECRKAHRTGTQVALLFIDLDHFKEINDTFGHDKGDLLLREAARRIRSCVREADTVARPGGDEFALILSDLGGVADLDRIVGNIIEVLHAPFDLDGGQGIVSASIGITLYPNDARDAESLFKNVDRALYLAKEQGRDRFAYFTESLQRRADEKRMLTADLRNAVARHEFEVHYQPIICSESGLIVKAEALLRWRHPHRGMVSPAEFIPIAEESGLIFEIGEWVLQQAIADAETFRRSSGHPVEIAVNMSPLQFADSGRRDRWLADLERIPADSITIEITESVLLKDSSRVKERLLQLQAHGVHVSIDDFGTGFSALSYLKKFHIDYLKIDRTFTSGLLDDPSDRALSEAIIVMANKLGIRTIAEGVETEAQRKVLVELGADFLQGFLFSPAVPRERLIGMLAQEPFKTTA